ncbi:NAD-dependent epimerase/dehydratase family protein [Gammaproteobacteria bacterium]|nr:NAD-dependent epimerase/dehydratase family protein [Gammaproteobacteria bacterium]
MDCFWQSRSVLVTGAAGFTGYNLTLALQRLGANVRTFVRRGGSKRDFPEGIDVFTGDLTNVADCERACEGIDTVFHVAAVFRQVKGTRAELEEVHVGATENMLRAAHKNHCRRFVHTSTMGVHGHIVNGPGDENSPFSPGDDYQDTKLEGELRALTLGKELGVPVSVVRPCGIYGPGDTRFLKIVKPVSQGRFVMIGSGETHYHFAYIDDLVQGFLLAGEKDAAVGESFLIGGEESPTLNELVQTIASIVGVKPPRWRIPVWPIYYLGWACEIVCKVIGIEPILHRRRVAFFTKNREYKMDKAKRLLGYEPKVNLHEGFSRMIDWYKKKGFF